MSADEAYDRLARQVRRLPFAVNVTRKVTQGATQVLDFDISFPDGSMRSDEGRSAEILGSSVVMSHGTIDDFLLRFPPVSGEYADPDELREVMETALRGTPYEDEVEIQINPDSPNGNEWTPHVIARTWPPYPDVDDFVETLRQAFDHYEEAVFDPDVARFMSAPTPGFASAKQGSGIGFQAPGDDADLFHVTRTQDAESIARDGLLPNSPSATEKRAYEDAGQDPTDPDEPMIEEPRDTQADRIFDESVRDAKYATDNEQYPDHEFAVFFWTREKTALRTAEEDKLRSIVVAVDSSKLPSECAPAAGDIRPLDTLWGNIWRGLGVSGEVPSDERMLDLAGEYWDSVEWYEPGVEPGGSETEVFMQCTVPPAAIEAIYNPETGRVLYEPAEADQRTLREFSSP